MQQRKIIIFLTALLILSSLWLSFVSQKMNDPDYQKNWWALYFSDPKSDNLDFAIENHSDKKDFHWEISVDRDKIKEGDIEIEKGKSQKLSFEQNLGNLENKKITITVSASDEKKEIYKNNE